MGNIIIKKIKSICSSDKLPSTQWMVNNLDKMTLTSTLPVWKRTSQERWQGWRSLTRRKREKLRKYALIQMSLKNFKPRSSLHTSIKKDQPKLLKVNTDNKTPLSKIHKSKWKCSEERRWLIKPREPLPPKNKCSYTIWRKMSKAKWLKENNWENKLIKNTLRKDQTLMPLLIRWLTKITRWWGSPKWNRSRANKIWFFPWTKRKLYWKDKKSLRSMKKNWLEDMLNNKVKELKNFNKWKRLLRRKEMLSSESLLKKKLLEELRRNMSRI